jgi:hypothetical protein
VTGALLSGLRAAGQVRVALRPRALRVQNTLQMLREYVSSLAIDTMRPFRKGYTDQQVLLFQ